MLLTRKRWDAYMLAGALLLLAVPGTLAVVKGDYFRGLVAPLGVLPLVLLRFQIPKQGYESTPIRKLPLEQRRLLLWCSVNLLLAPMYVIIAFSLRAEWLIWVWLPMVLLPTLWLAHQADRARGTNP